MTYPPVSFNSAGDELNRLHTEIERKLKSTVQDAIRAGEILTNLKERMPHGDFLPWVKTNCSFSTSTADKYRKLYVYQNKIPSSGNLQDAYRQIETIEQQAKQSEGQKARERIRQYLSTGEKPEGWRRGTDDKLVQEEEERKQRIEAARQKSEEAEQKRQEQRERVQSDVNRLNAEAEWFESAVGQISEQHEKRASFKERIRVSDTGRDDAFVDALMDYLEELPDDNRRIESCYNIIKVAKGIAVELQKSKEQ